MTTIPLQGRPSIAISTTYPEAALLAIAKAADKRAQLVRFFTTWTSERWLERLADNAPLARLREPLHRELVRRSLSGLSADSVSTTATGMDLLHRASRLLPYSEALGQRLEYMLKARFDAAVARMLNTSASNTVIAMYASAEETLRTARRSGRQGVLHLVNNLPSYRNRCLRELAQVPAGHHELVPERVNARVERELSLADLVLVPSRAIAQQLQSVGIPLDNVLLQPYGVDTAAFHPPPTGRRTVAKNPLQCLFVGGITHGKGVRFLLEAARQLRRGSVQFLLIGPLRAPELLQDLPGNVELVSGVLHNEVAEAMRRADLFVMPSVEDAYPLVVLEAMASCLPVILSDHTGTSEIVTHGLDGLIVKAGETDALVTAIEQLAEDEELRWSIGEAGRRRIETGPSWDTYGDGVLDRLGRHDERASFVPRALPA